MFTLSRSLRALAAGALVIGFSIAVTPAASAAGESVVDNGNGTVTVAGMPGTVQSNIAVVFCAPSVAANQCGGYATLYYSELNGTYGEGSVVRGNAPLAAGTYTVSIIDGTGPVFITGQTNVVIGSVPPAGGDQTPPPLPPVRQELPMPASGSCTDVKDADYAWGTGLTGGWQKAWGEWANAMVCGRTLTYTSDWRIA